MIRRQTNMESTLIESNADSIASNAVVTQAKLTLFAIPKRFEGHVGTIQRNAIRSWAQLQPQVEIVLFGNDDPELSRLAEEVGAELVSLRANESGTPVLADAFEFVSKNCHSPVNCYVNCDIMLGAELLEVAQDLQDSDLESFVGIGQRMTYPVVKEIAATDGKSFDQLFRTVRQNGRRDSIVCKDYFLFSQGQYQTIPEFLVGRGNWDNWMVSNAKSNGIPVVDLSQRLTAIHQDHDYSHVPGGRKNAYVFGEEARENQRLAGGRNLVFGSTPTWELSTKGLKKRRFPILAMLKDVSKFVSLLRNLLILGYLATGSAFS